MKFFVNRVWVPVYETNDIDAYIPEFWAQESLMILEANMVVANLIHRDFSDEVAQFGDVVNTRKPATYTAARKGVTDDVSIQNSEATNVAVPLDQHVHTSFLIRDGEESKGFKDLIQEYLYPAVLSLSEYIDSVLLMHMYMFVANGYGSLGTAPTVATLLGTRQVMNEKRVPLAGRNLIVTPEVEADLLGIDAFHEADKVGDDGTAMREASLGRKFGFNTFMCQQCPSIAAGNTTYTAAINLTAGYAAGSTSVVVDAAGDTIVAGEWCTIAGDMTPQLITATNGSTTMTLSPGLKTAVANNAVVTIYQAGASNVTAGNAAAFYNALVVDGFTVAPKEGQLITLAADGAEKYGAIGTPTTTSITLDRPLDAATSNNDVVGIGPSGEYNFAFHRNALAMVSRPLAAPKSGTGALSAVVNHNGVGLRVTITYDGTKQGHLVTVDLLMGVKQLDEDLGCLMYG